MARKTAEVVITAEGRDQGKRFLLQEMPPTQSERWGMRALLALAKTMDVPEDTVRQGIAGLQSIGVGKMISNLSFSDADDLMREMFDSCVYIVPDPANPRIFRGPSRPVVGVMPVGPLVEEDIEEVSTRLKLRMEILQLHMGFSLPAVDWKSILTNLMAAGASQNTSTSPAPSARSSRRAKPR